MAVKSVESVLTIPIRMRVFTLRTYINIISKIFLKVKFLIPGGEYPLRGGPRPHGQPMDNQL